MFFAAKESMPSDPFVFKGFLSLHGVVFDIFVCRAVARGPSSPPSPVRLRRGSLHALRERRLVESSQPGGIEGGLSGKASRAWLVANTCRVSPPLVSVNS